MENMYKFLAESVNSGKIDRQTAIEMIKLLKQEEDKHKNTGNDIAIIGMAASLPGAKDIEEFWDNIQNGLDLVSRFPETRSRDITEYLQYANRSSDEVKYTESGFLSEIDKFDYKFFHISPREASLMDPAQRIFLEVAWQVLEDAGYGGKKLSGSNTGLYVGFAGNVKDLYAKLITDVDPTLLSISMTGNLTSIIPGRLSYLLDLKGPSMIVDSACSSALVCVDLACQSIRNGSCDYAIAGGINIDTVPVDKDYLRIGIESSDGKTRTFDEFADGSGIGEGVAAVLLKPLKKALEDKDNIYAVIKGSAINQDGSSAGLTAPNPAAQADAIIKAWESAGIDPTTISYIETHGTGTNLGDPIEIKGIQNAFRKYTDKRQFCAIGSVKTNMGHLCEAAGIVGLIKAVMALRNKQLPRTIFFNRPNSAINFTDSPVYVNARHREWDAQEHPRRCGVSSFGISGTNCHVVLEEAAAGSMSTGNTQGFNVLTVSAANGEVLNELVRMYSEFLNKDSVPDLTSICYTANTGRGHYNYRLAVISESIHDLRKKFKTFDSGRYEGVDMFYGQFKVVGQNQKITEHYEITKKQKRELDEQAKKKIDEYLDKNRKVEILEEICRLYVSGADVDWEDFYKEDRPVKTSLPVYPFERSRCWIDVPKFDQTRDIDVLTNMYHKVIWLEEQGAETAELQDGTVVVLRNEQEDSLTAELTAGLKEEKREIIEVSIGKEFVKCASNSYTIRNTEEDFIRLFADCSKLNIKYIVHLLTLNEQKEVNTVDELEESQSKGVYSLFYIVRAMVQNGIEKDTNIFMVSRFANDVTGAEVRLNPENATLAGLGKTVKHEVPGVRCKFIDIDNTTGADDLLSEMKRTTNAYQVAYRNGKRYIEEFDEFDIASAEEQKVEIRDEGVYIITGGTGGIGLEIARYLSSKNKVKIALLSRSELPARELWDDVLLNGEEKVQRCIRYVREIEAAGSQVIGYSTEISNMKEVRRIINELRENFGRINGIFHCAGIAGGSFIIRRKKEEVDAVLNPKVYGTWVLDQLTREDNPDFFVMCSSGLSVLGEPGNGDYTAANCYMETYSAYRQKNGLKTLVIDWASWKEIGMSVVFGINRDMIFKAILTKQGINALDEVMNRNISRVMVGELNNDPKYFFMLDWAALRFSPKLKTYLEMSRKSQKEGTDNAGRSGKVDLKGRDSQEFSEIEKKVASIYHEVLGLEEINIYDSFFELGGDSIMLNRLYELLDKEFPNKLKLIDAFSYTSIASLSQVLAGGSEEIAATADSEVDEFLNMFDEIDKGKLSIEDAVKSISDI